MAINRNRSRRATSDVSASSTTVVSLSVSAITVDPSLNCRDELNEATIEHYAAIFDRLPPVTVFRLPDGTHLLSAGFHRIAAAKRLGLAEIKAVVREGKRADAEEFAILDNTAHGMAYTRDERRKAIERMLRLRPKWANKRLADALGVSKNTVEGVRQDLETACQIDRLNELTGADGKTYPRKLAAPASRSPLGVSGSPGEAEEKSETRRAMEPAQALAQSISANERGIGLSAGVPAQAGWSIESMDVLEWAKTYSGPPFSAIFCDPPYHLLQQSRNGSQRNPGTGPYGRHVAGTKGFMAQEWDGGDISFDPLAWAALAEHLLPGGFVVVFASSRGHHRVACAMEDAGLLMRPTIFDWRAGRAVEVPDLLGWATGSSMPKATRIDTAIDAEAGAERQVVGRKSDGSGRRNQRNQEQGYRPNAYSSGDYDTFPVTAPATPLAQTWAGHRYGGQMLKNALEPIIVAQKPYAGRPVDSMVTTGAGAMWIDGARIDGPEGDGVWGTRQENCRSEFNASPGNAEYRTAQHPLGRWPSNLVVCHSESCRCVGTRRVKNTSGSVRGTEPSHTGDENANCYGEFGRVPFERHADAEGEEVVEVWACLCGCGACGSTWTAGDDGRAFGGVEFVPDGTWMAYCSKCDWWQGGTQEKLAQCSKCGGQIAEWKEQTGPRPKWASDQNKCPVCGSGETRWLCPVKALDEQSGESKLSGGVNAGSLGKRIYGGYSGKVIGEHRGGLGDVGGASRFYYNADWSYERAEAEWWEHVAQQLAEAEPVLYTPKAGGRERHAMTPMLYWRVTEDGYAPIDWDEWKRLGQQETLTWAETGKRPRLRAAGNVHVAVKPLSLTVFLARLLLPPAQYAPRRILVPFSGSGSEMVGCMLAGWEEIVGIERERIYSLIAEARLTRWQAQGRAGNDAPGQAKGEGSGQAIVSEGGNAAPKKAAAPGQTKGNAAPAQGQDKLEVASSAAPPPVWII